MVSISACPKGILNPANILKCNAAQVHQAILNTAVRNKRLLYAGFGIFNLKI